MNPVSNNNNYRLLSITPYTYDILVNNIERNKVDFTYYSMPYFRVQTRLGECSGCFSICEECEPLHRYKRRRVYYEGSNLITTSVDGLEKFKIIRD